jgi:hypothetical protein
MFYAFKWWKQTGGLSNCYDSILSESKRSRRRGGNNNNIIIIIDCLTTYQTAG